MFLFVNYQKLHLNILIIINLKICIRKERKKLTVTLFYVVSFLELAIFKTSESIIKVEKLLPEKEIDGLRNEKKNKTVF